MAKTYFNNNYYSPRLGSFGWNWFYLLQYVKTAYHSSKLPFYNIHGYVIISVQVSYNFSTSFRRVLKIFAKYLMIWEAKVQIIDSPNIQHQLDQPLIDMKTVTVKVKMSIPGGWQGQGIHSPVVCKNVSLWLNSCEKVGRALC